MIRDSRAPAGDVVGARFGVRAGLGEVFVATQGWGGVLVDFAEDPAKPGGGVAGAVAGDWFAEAVVGLVDCGGEAEGVPAELVEAFAAAGEFADRYAAQLVG